MIKAQGAINVDLRRIEDSPEAIRRALDDAAERSDLILTSGGVSVGVADHMRAVLAENGQLNFWKIAVKPGRPQLAGGRTRGFWPPGNLCLPWSHLINCKTRTRPIGRVQPSPTVQLRARVGTRLTKQPGRMEFQRGRLSNDTDGTLVVSTTGLQDSHVLTSLTGANCLIVLPVESRGAEVGDQVEVIPTNVAWGV